MTVIVPGVRTAGTTVFSANNVANPTNLSPTLPTRVRGDVLLCWAWCRSNTATVATPANWTSLFAVQASGTGSGGSIYCFAALVDGSEGAPSVSWSGVTTGTSGDANGSVINAYTGIDVSRGISNIVDAAVQKSDQAGSTTTVTIPAITTATKNSLQVALAVKLLESAGATFTAPAGGWVEDNDSNTTSGTGHWMEISHVVQATIGSVGSTTCTPSVTTSSRALSVSFSLKCAKPPRSMGMNQHPTYL